MTDSDIEGQKAHLLKIIDDFRKDFDMLDDFERQFIAPQMLFTNPCQVEIIWVLEPIEFQLLVLFHNPHRQDKEIIVQGPFKTAEIGEKVIKIMEEPRWRERAPVIADTWNISPDVGDMEHKYSDEFWESFYDFLRWINLSSAYSFPLGFVSSRLFGSNDMCFVFRGNVTNISPDELNQKSSIEAARMMAADKRAKKTEVISHIPEPQKNMRTFFGAYFTPAVRIGDDVELSFREKVFGPDSFQYPKYEFGFTFHNRMGFYDRYGLVLIESVTEEESIKIINSIFAISLIQGIEAFSVRKSEIVHSESPFDQNPLGKPLGSYSRKISEITGNAPNFFARIRSTQIHLNEMDTILRLSERVFQNQKLNELLLFLLESNTHLKNYEFSQAYIFCWLIVEQHISKKFRILSSGNKEIVGKRGKKQDPDKERISNKMKLLYSNGNLDVQEYSFLTEYNKKRNDFVHSGKIITESDAENLFKFALKIIQNEIAALRE